MTILSKPAYKLSATPCHPLTLGLKSNGKFCWKSFRCSGHSKAKRTRLPGDSGVASNSRWEWGSNHMSTGSRSTGNQTDRWGN